MGSYCAIRFDDIEVLSYKSGVPDDFCAIFQEGDRLQLARGDDEGPEVMYRASREIVLARLALLGCTPALAKERFEFWLQAEREDWAENLAESGEWAEPVVDALSNLTFDEWQRRVPRCLATRYSEAASIDEIDRHMREDEAEWLWFDRSSLANLRALLDASPSVRNVTLDISDLIIGGWISESTPLCAERRREYAIEPRPLAPVVVLGEGSSDIRILQRSLEMMFPERRDYFSFFNHSELNVDGGTSYLIKFLKAFAAAGAPFRMIAVFDNDTTGIQAFRQATSLGLPDNILLTHLPDIDIARSYPTVGPQGTHVVDVNGKAAGIELYLGRAALSRDGELRPVRWSGYNQAAGAYQGEVESKTDVERNFLEDLNSRHDASGARAAFPEMATVWSTIFAEVERAAEAAESAQHTRTRLD